MKQTKHIVVNRRPLWCLLLLGLLALCLVSCSAGMNKEGAPKGLFADDGARISAYSKDGVGKGEGTPGEIGIDSPVEKQVEKQTEEVPVMQAGLLTAAEWRDNAHWDFWKKLINENKWYELADKWHLFATRRVVVTLGTPEAPIAGAEVVLRDAAGQTVWQAVSDRTGTAYLFWGVDGKTTQPGDEWKITVSAGEETESCEWNGEEAVSMMTGVAGAAQSPRLDLMFTVDTTGSMGDELEYLKLELANVVTRVQNECQLTARVSVNFYRDTEDDYLVRAFPFGSVEAASAQIAKQSANGGGDYPEAVHSALKNAIVEHEWSTAPEAVKLMFLVLDAPAHDEEAVKESLRVSVTEAAAQGIRVIPVMCSGVEADCEELCRSFAVLTGGTYIFLTNDSGIGGDHLEATVGEYQVERLNDLLVRVINDYCK